MDWDAKIRPFPNQTELMCVKKSKKHEEHVGVLEDYAYPGSHTEIVWQESDRRTFRGDWVPCYTTACVLPANHRSGHAF